MSYLLPFGLCVWRGTDARVVWADGCCRSCVTWNHWPDFLRLNVYEIVKSGDNVVQTLRNVYLWNQWTVFQEASNNDRTIQNCCSFQPVNPVMHSTFSYLWAEKSVVVINTHCLSHQDLLHNVIYQKFSNECSEFAPGHGIMSYPS